MNPKPIALAALLLLPPSSLSASTLYVGWSAGSNGYLDHYDVPTRASVRLIGGTGSIAGIGGDPGGDDAYFWHRSSWESRIYRDNEPGVYQSTRSDLDQLALYNGTFDATHRYQSLALTTDPASRSIIYARSNSPTGIRDPRVSIESRHMDTGVVTTIYSAGRSGHEIKDLAVDSAGGYVYWTDEDAGTIFRRDLLAQNPVQTVYTGLILPRGIAVDPVSGRVFWSELGNSSNPSAIYSANLDGSGGTITLRSHADTYKLEDLAVDADSGVLYFIERVVNAENGVVRQMDFSGGNVADFTNAGGSPVSGDVIAFSADGIPEPSVLLMLGSFAGLGFWSRGSRGKVKGGGSSRPGCHAKRVAVAVPRREPVLRKRQLAP